jgi:hypothetical protein
MKTKEILTIHCLALLGIALIASLFKKVPGIVKNGSFFIAIVLLAVSQVLGKTNEPLIQKTDTNAPVLYTNGTMIINEKGDFFGSYTNRSSGSYKPFAKTDKKGSFGFGLRETDYCFPSKPEGGGRTPPDPNYNANPFPLMSFKCGETDVNKITNNNPKWDDKNNVWQSGPNTMLKRPRNTDGKLDKHGTVNRTRKNPQGIHLNWDKICMTPCCRSQIAFCCRAFDPPSEEGILKCIKDRGCHVDINGNKLNTDALLNNCCWSTGTGDVCDPP